jgi:hypothetical protein
MAIALWSVMATLIATFIVWRLRRANHTLSTILREERERVDDLEPVEEDQKIGRHRRA